MNERNSIPLKFLFFIVSFFIGIVGSAQIITDPALPVASEKVIITFDSSKESRLGFYTGDLYAHTGVIIEGNASWQHVIGNWGDNTIQPKLSNKGNGIYELEITPDIQGFYTVPSNEKVLKMAFVFRSTDSKKQTDNLFVTVYPEGVVDEINESKPAAYKKGINYPTGNSAALVLWAPQKKHVFVLGDFNDWQLSNDFRMKKDGDYFWLDIPNLESGKEYAFQYLIDGNIKVADPYAEKLLDPLNDNYISDDVYPNLISYPENKTEGIASVLQPGQVNYNWEITDFQIPEKEKLVIYELLVRDFMTEHTYKAVREKLDYLEDLRINVLELMPINEFEGNSSWGYNPSFYFAPDKYYGPKNELKKLIDECHKRGIAVVIDMVLNHSYGQSPFVQMYMDNWTILPENPWYNVKSPNTVYQWGYDFNHETDVVKELVDSVNSFWMNEYKIDGFRFDFSKGFTNTPGDGSAFDQSRINILNRMATEIWKRNPDALVILEHLTENSEETNLANKGMLLWGNLNHDYSEAAMGYSSDFTWGLYIRRGWDEPNLVSYMESHDEERIIYKCLNFGNSNGDYNTKKLATALDRVKLNSVFFLPLPGPKMIWQFGELGYDYSINNCEDGTINNDCRTSPKPIRWDYLENPDRVELFHVMAKLNELKQTYPEFTPESFSYDLTSTVKWYRLTSGSNHVFSVGNFDIQQKTANVTFPKTGKWYEFFTRDSVEISSVYQSIQLAPGEYRLYSTRKFDEPQVVTENKEITSPTKNIVLFPNPAQTEINITAPGVITGIQVYSGTGKLMMNRNNGSVNQFKLNIKGFTPGVYILKVVQSNQVSTMKFVKE